MKATVVTDQKGNVIAFSPAPHNDYYRSREEGRPGEFRGGLLASPDQQIHEVDVPEDFPSVPDIEELQTKLKAALQKRR